MKQTIIYKFEKDIDTINNEALPENYNIKWWRPSCIRFIPPGKSKKYFMYWLFHYFRIFKSRDYAAFLLYDNQTLITSFLIVPAYFKWPFMNNNDLQFTYVMTHKSYRGQGLAAKALRYALEKFYRPERSFWYVTDNENKASMRLAEKLEFKQTNY